MIEASKIINDFICCASNGCHIVDAQSSIQICGKYACEECLHKLDEFYCQSCKQRHGKLPKINTPSSVLMLLEKYRNDFNQLLENKAKYEDLMDNLNAENFLNDFNRQKDLVKHEIDLRIESIKAELDEYRDKLYDQIENAENHNVKEVSLIDFESLKQKYKQFKTTDDFSLYEESMENLEYEINHLKSPLLSIEYKPNNFEMEMEIICDLKIEKNKCKLKYGNFSGFFTVPLSNDRLATISNCAIELFDFHTGENINMLTEYEDVTTYCLSSLPNNYLASGNDDGTITIWNLDNYKHEKKLRGHEGIVIALKPLPNSKLASGSYDNTVRIWDLDNYILIYTFFGHFGRVLSLEYILNDRLASGDTDSTIKIWNLNNYSLIQTLDGHKNRTSCLKIISNSLLASGGSNPSIKLWDLKNYTCVGMLDGHLKNVTCILHLSNNRLVSGSLDKSIKIWSLNDFSCIDTLREEDAIFGLISLSTCELISISYYYYKIWSKDNFSCIKKVNLEF